MILFFHFICLLARYIVLNISKTFMKPRVLSDENTSKSTSDISSSENCPKRRLQYTKNPSYENGFLKFFPPVFVQRYETVTFTLQDSELEGKIRKVVDFGCAELGFFMYLKNIESVTEILEVDIDSDILERYSFKAAPLTSDYLMGKRDKPLDVYILAGNVADYDDRLLGCDAVVAIELIEHLTEEDFKKMPYNIFYKIRPKIAIFTTPNADFNSLLPNFTHMRHKDHRFEWTRKEFFTWTQEILQEYPEYYVRFFGIGAGPEGTENLGCCSQMAVFRRSEDTDSFVTSRDKPENIQSYKLIKHYEFPAYVDNRTTEEKIIHEIQYRAAYIKGLDMYYNYETNQSEIPLSLLKEYVSDLYFNDEELLKILNNSGMTLKNKDNAWFLVYSDTESNSSECNFSFDNWLNEEILVNDAFDTNFTEKWSDEEHLNLDKLGHFQSAISLKEFSSDAPTLTSSPHEENQECVLALSHRNRPVSQNHNHLLKTDNFLQTSPTLDVKNREIRKSSLLKSRIPFKISGREKECIYGKKANNSHVCKPFKKISRSVSLDSYLENINFKLSVEESYLNLIVGSSLPFNHFSPILSSKRKHWVNHSDSSLLNGSFDRASDSGYPFSFSPPNADLTSQQIDEIYTEDETSGPTLSFSKIEIPDSRLYHDVFIENLPMENGDVANNNCDNEDNNMEE